MPDTTVAESRLATNPRSVRRYLLAVAGIILTGIAYVGIFVPGLPTVGFLLMASYCFARSCPWLEQRLIRNRHFARFTHYLDGDLVMPLRARISAIILMWTSIGISCAILAFNNRSIFLTGGIVAAGCAGTIAIWFYRREKKPT